MEFTSVACVPIRWDDTPLNLVRPAQLKLKRKFNIPCHCSPEYDRGSASRFIPGLYGQQLSECD